MCNCIEQLEEQIKRVDPEASGFQEKQMYMNPNAKVGDSDIYYYRLAGHFTARKKNKDGSFSTRKVLNVVNYTYCPFCGEKY